MVDARSVELDSVPALAWGSLPMAYDRGVGWAELRDVGPVVKCEQWYYVTDRDDVLTALRQPELFSSKKAFDALGSPLPLVPIAFDPPEHTKFRKILQPFFSPGTLDAMLPSLQVQAVDIVAMAAADGRCEAIADLAIPYPSQVFLTLFGLPLADRDRLIAWKDAVIHLAEISAPTEAQLAPAFELYSYLVDVINENRANPGEGVLSQLLSGADPLSDAEAIGLAFLFVLAGLDTVTSTLGTALLTLARNPQLRRDLRLDPKKTRFFVEEIVRLEAPAPLVPRVTTTEVTLGGVRMPEGTHLYLCIGCINRDNSEPGSSNRVVIDKVHRHWGFGGGPHRCLGSHLARMELTLVIDEWLRRVPDFDLAEGYTPRIRFPATSFGLESLPLTFPT